MGMRIASADTAVMSEYVEWLGQVRGRAPLTLKSYEATLGCWGSWLATRGSTLALRGGIWSYPISSASTR